MESVSETHFPNEHAQPKFGWCLRGFDNSVRRLNATCFGSSFSKSKTYISNTDISAGSRVGAMCNEDTMQ